MMTFQNCLTVLTWAVNSPILLIVCVLRWPMTCFVVSNGAL